MGDIIALVTALAAGAAALGSFAYRFPAGYRPIAPFFTWGAVAAIGTITVWNYAIQRAGSTVTRTLGLTAEGLALRDSIDTLAIPHTPWVVIGLLAFMLYSQILVNLRRNLDALEKSAGPD